MLKTLVKSIEQSLLGNWSEVLKTDGLRQKLLEDTLTRSCWMLLDLLPSIPIPFLFAIIVSYTAVSTINMTLDSREELVDSSRVGLFQSMSILKKYGTLKCMH